MTLRNTLALSFAAALFSVTVVGAANAATHHRMMHSSSHRMMHSRGHMASSDRSMPTDADHSADSLNGQSLTRAQGAQ